MPPRKKERPQVWAVKLDGRVTQIRRLPMRVLVEIAEQTNHSLVEVVGLPLGGNGAAAEPVVRAVAELHGYKDLPAEMSFDDVLAAFDYVDEDLPEAMSLEDDEHAPDPTGAAS